MSRNLSEAEIIQIKLDYTMAIVKAGDNFRADIRIATDEATFKYLTTCRKAKEEAFKRGLDVEDMS